jgi:branched-chain amino acid aminotransferase
VHSLVHHNGRTLPLAEARLSPGQSGLLTGWGVFTTTRVYEGRPFAFQRHWNRLCTDAERIRLPLAFTLEGVRAALDEVLKANQVVNGCARLYFLNNKAGFWHSEEDLPVTDLLICTSDLPMFPRPTSLAVQERGRDSTHPLVNVKVTSWLHNVWSLEQAHGRGFDEVILLNERGEVAECTSANVFRVSGGAIETPPLSSGCLPGITREVLLEIGAGAGLSIRERALTLKDLYAAEEVFITSTSREALPVGRIEDHQVPQAEGPMTGRAAQTFSRYVVEYFAKSATNTRPEP